MDKIDELLTRGVEKIYPSREALEKVLRSGKKLKLYQGFDPTMPSLTVGNLVGLQKLRQFQALGHEVIFLVGDFTGMIGDPTDKAATRSKLTREQTIANSRSWKKQAEKTVSFTGQNPAKLLFNSQWLDKISLKDFFEICSNFTTQQMLERDFFQKRIKEGKPIHMHELLYPVTVAIDCVEMDVDLEVGGNDQTFNMLAGRTLMSLLKGKEKFVLTTKLLVDANGVKVGKTAGNALFLDATPSDLFGGIMSFPDEVIGLSFELLTTLPMEKVSEVGERLKSGENPMVLKKELAFQIVSELHSTEAAQKAQEEFEKTFQFGEVTNTDIPTITLSSLPANPINAVTLIHQCISVSNSEAKRLLEQKALEINGQAISTNESGIKISAGDVIRIGKKNFVKFI